DDFFTTKTRRHQVSDGNPLACAFGKLTICTTINRTQVNPEFSAHSDDGNLLGPRNHNIARCREKRSIPQNCY
ncbi:MAG TPA: hypothetical protein VK970_08155, partial [Candidatus Methylacidiphilales bacterium]|nr:hypothetical protein [Candidatus Methylacidiphilales bacterium]